MKALKGKGDVMPCTWKSPPKKAVQIIESPH